MKAHNKSGAAVAYEVLHPFPTKGYGKLWRSGKLMAVLRREKLACTSGATNGAAARPSYCALQHGDVYEFGVYTGRALKYLVKRLPEVRKFWGFDSFVGMPSSSGDGAAEQGISTAFPSGSLSVSALVTSKLNKASIDPVAHAMDAVQNYVGDSRLQLVPGFFSSSLTSTLARGRGMAPALYVDIDCDIYAGARDALRWMVSTGLIVPGTLVGYDDWSYGQGRREVIAELRASHTPVQNRSSVWRNLKGEPRAHKEVSDEFGLVWEELYSPATGKTSAAIFRLVSRKGRATV